MADHDPGEPPPGDEARKHLPATVTSADGHAHADDEAPREETATERFLREMEEDLPEGYLHFPEAGLLYQLTKTGAYAPLCSPIRVLRRLRTPEGTGWSLEIALRDFDGRIRTVIVPAGVLDTRPTAVVTALVDVGLDLPGKPVDLTAFIKAWEVDATGYLVDRAGWLDLPDGASVFIRPDGEVRGSNPATEVVQLSGATPIPVSGTLRDWQTTIGRWSVGNPALITGVAMGFVEPLLGPSRLDTLGINLHSKTSSGKSTVARAARSTQGCPKKLTRWNASSAGIELLTTAAHDALLILDEFPRVPTRAPSTRSTSSATGPRARAARPR